MAYPVSHKTVFVLDHSPNFSMPCDVVEFDSIKSSMQAAARQIPIAPIYKTMWTSMSESLLEYCRIVWDIFPPDCQEQKLIRFVLSGSDTQFLNRWDSRDQTVEVLKNALARVGRPEPESRRKSAHAKGYNISNGIEAGMKILCEYTDVQKHESQKLKNCDKNPIGVLNRGRIIVLTHLDSQDHLNSILETFKSQVVEINQVAATSKVLSTVSNVELFIVHCYAGNRGCNINEVMSVDDPRKLVELAPNISYQVLTVDAGAELSKKLLSLALRHYDLASTTVTGIPMKEEQNASSSANYDVELFHKASAHVKLLASNEFNTIAAGGASSASAEALQNWIPQTRKEGYEYSTITLKWCTPRNSTQPDLHNCTGIARVTPTDVNSRPSSCLTNFLLNGRSVMLEMPRKTGSKLLSHMLTSHAGEIFIHTLNISRSVLEDPPSVTETPGGRVTDYRLQDLGDLMKSNRLAPWYGSRNTIYPHPDDPLEKAYHRLTRHTLKCPLTTSSTTIFNMASVDPLQKILVQEELTEENLAKCRNVIYSLIKMESKGDPLPVPMQTTSNNKTKTLKKEEQYKMMFGELERYIAAHCRTEDHKKVLDFLLEVIGKSDKISSNNSRGNALTNDANVSTVDKDKVELDVALQQLDKYSAMTEREKSDFNLSNDGVLRSTVESPMSPTSFSSEPFPKKSRLGIASGTSLLEIWTTRIEKENAKKHVPFAGERSLGEKAKLYLSLERKDNDGSNDRSGVSSAEI